MNSSQIENSEKDSKAFIDNVSINTTIYGQYADFLFQMALTITRETIKSMKKLEEFKSLDQKSSKYRAIEKLGLGVYDRID